MGHIQYWPRCAPMPYEVHAKSFAIDLTMQGDGRAKLLLFRQVGVMDLFSVVLSH